MITTHEKSVSLNVHELESLSALQSLDHGDENQIAREFGSSRALHDRLKVFYDNMDQSTVLTYDCNPLLTLS